MCKACDNAESLSLIFICSCGGTDFEVGSVLCDGVGTQLFRCLTCKQDYGIPCPMIAKPLAGYESDLVYYRKPTKHGLLPRKWKWEN